VALRRAFRSVRLPFRTVSVFSPCGVIVYRTSAMVLALFIVHAGERVERVNGGVEEFGERYLRRVVVYEKTGFRLLKLLFETDKKLVH
jgi:hypothetical protein